MGLPIRMSVAAVAIAGGGLVAGGVFAAGITNFTASTLSLGEASTTTCFTDADTSVSVQATPSWDNNLDTFAISETTVSITDDDTVGNATTVECAGMEVKVVALNSSGDELDSGSAPISINGDVTNLSVPLDNPVDANSVTDWGLAVYTQ